MGSWTRASLSMSGLEEDRDLPLSGIQHVVFCERQCALIHIEGVWCENVFTTEGAILHARVDEGATEQRGTLRIERSVPLRSRRLGLVGIADVVEFCLVGADWKPSPIEYKRGEPRNRLPDEVQVCAQAMALEEMLGVSIDEGALYYSGTKRRYAVPLTEELRARTETAARRFHEMVQQKETPPAREEPKCQHCSLRELCLPNLPDRRRPLSVYLYEAQRERS